LGQPIHIKKFQLFFHRISVPPATRSAEVPFIGATRIYKVSTKVEIHLKQTQHMSSDACQSPAVKNLCSLFLRCPCPAELWSADHTDGLWQGEITATHPPRPRESSNQCPCWWPILHLALTRRSGLSAEWWRLRAKKHAGALRLASEHFLKGNSLQRDQRFLNWNTTCHQNRGPPS